jgi:hypothetical protein
MTGRLRLLALSISLLLLVFLAGCSDSVSPDTRDSVSVQRLLSRTSPENVLFNLRLIYGDKDGLVTTAEEAQYWAEEYRKLFHPDFKFFFVPGDAPTDSFPEGYWGVENEVSSFEHMLLAIPGHTRTSPPRLATRGCVRDYPGHHSNRPGRLLVPSSWCG